MLLQLAPVFAKIAAVAVHRDVNAHNILIDGVHSGGAQFGLVDFGLAVDITCWQRAEDSNSTGSRPSRVGQDGACTWHHLDVGGDCRYWPVSAWAQFLLGWTELDAHPPWRFEYQTQLDLHSLGLTALQAFVDMLPILYAPLEPTADDDLGLLMAALNTLQLQWEQYWNTVTPLHSALMDTFHNGGDWDALKTEFLSNNVHGTVAHLLKGLRAAIFDLEQLCRQRSPGPEVAEAAGLFEGLNFLVNDGSRPVEDAAHGPSRWTSMACAVLGGTKAAATVAERAGGSAASTASTSGQVTPGPLITRDGSAPMGKFQFEQSCDDSMSRLGNLRDRGNAAGLHAAGRAAQANYAGIESVNLA